MNESPRNQSELDAKLHEMRLTVLTRHLQTIGAEVSSGEVRALLNLNLSDQKIIQSIRQKQSLLFKLRTSRLGRVMRMKS